MRKNLLKNNSYTFLRGAKAPNLSFIYYQSISDLEKILKSTLVKIKPIKLEKFNFIATNLVKDTLKAESDKRGVSQSKLLRSIVEDWIESRQS